MDDPFKEIEQEEKQRWEEGRTKRTEIAAKKAKEEERAIAGIRDTHGILGPFPSGTYWPKNKHEYEWKNDPLTKLLTWNKHGLLTEDSLEKLSNLMYKTLEQNTNPDNIEIIIPVPNHLRHSAACKGQPGCWIDKPNRCAPPLAKAFAAMICKKRNRKNCHSHDDVLVKFQKSDLYRKQSGPDARIISAKKDYRIAEYIKENNHLIKNQIVLLIDDITTTDSTVKVCAGLLRDNGAREVIILCTAKTKRG